MPSWAGQIHFGPPKDSSPRGPFHNLAPTTGPASSATFSPCRALAYRRHVGPACRSHVHAQPFHLPLPCGAALSGSSPFLRRSARASSVAAGDGKSGEARSRNNRVLLGFAVISSAELHKIRADPNKQPRAHRNNPLMARGVRGRPPSEIRGTDPIEPTAHATITCIYGCGTLCSLNRPSEQPSQPPRHKSPEPGRRGLSSAGCRFHPR
jgi:hypothetical protein